MNKSKHGQTLIIIILVVLLVGTLKHQPTSQPAPQTRITIYRTFTVYEETHGDSLAVTELRIDTDDYPQEPCDGLASDENGHNCIILSHEQVNAFLVSQGVK